MAGLGFVMDVLLAALLIAVIGYAVVLNRKLAILRDAKSEFEQLLASFGETTEQAQTSLASLRDEATSVKQSFDGDLAQMEKSLAEVRGLSDDLEYLIKRGEKVADRLAGTDGKAAGEPTGETQAAEEDASNKAAASAQQKFLRTLQGVR